MIQNKQPQPSSVHPSAAKQGHRVTITVLAILALVFLILSGYFILNSFRQQDLIDDYQSRFFSCEVCDDIDVGEEDENADEEEDENTLWEQVIVPMEGPGYNAHTFGAVAELEGYLTTVEMATTLDGSGETKTCQAFYVTDAPENVRWHMDVSDLRYARFDGEPLIILGEEGEDIMSSWWTTKDIEDSSASSPLRAVFQFGSTFEGELIGCMDVVDFIGTTERPDDFVGG